MPKVLIVTGDAAESLEVNIPISGSSKRATRSTSPRRR